MGYERSKTQFDVLSVETRYLVKIARDLPVRLLCVIAPNPGMSNSPALPPAEPIVIEENSPLFEAVQMLWRRNSDHLGFFPAGAFSDCANRGMLVAAVSADEFLGYTAYRMSGDRAILIHLCVMEEARRRNVAKLLIDHVKQITKQKGLRGIGLSCRVDFDANSVWPRLGFSPRGERRGKKKDGSVLKLWWFDHGLPDLFSLAAAADSRRIQVAIDANVFYDLHCDRPHGEESRALEEDWLESELELSITDEIYCEIDRGEPAEKEQQRRFVDRYRLLRPDEQQRDKAAIAVREILGEGRKPSEVSDRAHLVKAAAAGVSVFLTRDNEIRAKNSELRAKLNIRALSPLELITELDEIRRQPAYQPAKMAESRIALQRVRACDVDGMQSQLCAPSEKPVDLKNRIRALVAAPDKNDVFQVLGDDARLAVIAFAQDGNTLHVPLLRILPSPLKETLAHHLSLRVVEEARKRGLPWIKIIDIFVDQDVSAALADAGFGASDEGFWRISSNTFGAMAEVLSSMRDVAEHGGTSRPAAMKLIADLHDSVKETPRDTAARVEQLFWPAKVMGEGITSWIVPIQRKWAQELVDPSLARQELFGSDPFLALNREHVYYRSVNPPGPIIPGRVLWYVSKDGHDDGTMHIRACSRVVAVDVGPATNLYRQNEHLGVFIWENVRDLAKGNAHASVMAFRFADTEVFRRPIPLAEAKLAGVRSNLPSPLAISDELFATLYRRGMGQIQ